MMVPIASTRHFVIRSWDDDPVGPVWANRIAAIADSKFVLLAQWFGLIFDPTGTHIQLPGTHPPSVASSFGPRGFSFENNAPFGEDNRITVYVGGTPHDVLPHETVPNALPGGGTTGYGYGHGTGGARRFFESATGGSPTASLSSGGLFTATDFTAPFGSVANIIIIGTGYPSSVLASPMAFQDIAAQSFIAELAEIFMTFIAWTPHPVISGMSGYDDRALPSLGTVWSPHKSDGEALSRVCAAEFFANGVHQWEVADHEIMSGPRGAEGSEVTDIFVYVSTPPPRMDLSQIDHLTDTNDTDRTNSADLPYIAYGVLAIYFMRSLGIAIPDIIAAGYPVGPVLGGSTYANTFNNLLNNPKYSYLSAYLAYLSAIRGLMISPSDINGQLQAALNLIFPTGTWPQGVPHTDNVFPGTLWSRELWAGSVIRARFPHGQ